MSSRLGQVALRGFLLFVVFGLMLLTPLRVAAAPYAAMVMDARTGEVLHSRNADTPLHPASLTKMMTLYIAFQAIQRGEIGLDSEVTITQLAASEPPSKLGLRAGQKIRLRYLLRAAAVKSANDAATAIGVAISGSEDAFATRMNRTARAMGMRNTNFRNAHGLTQNGHVSTARDMSILGRHVIYDYPQYYNLFSRRTADAGMARVAHTNTRWLNAYEGADGIKTGYTRAAGYNLVASAQRGQERVIATVFGGSSTAARNVRITELMDMGFSRAPSHATIRRPNAPVPTPQPQPEVIVGSSTPATNGGAGKTIRITGAITRSLRPQARPTREPATDLLLAVDTDVINSALEEVVQAASAAAVLPQPTSMTPQARPTEIVMQVAQVALPSPATTPVQEIVTRISTSGGRHWGVNIGSYSSRYEAERVLLKVALNEMSSLDGALRRVVQRSGGFDANFMGLTREGADLACRRLQARSTTCFMLGSDS